MRQQQHFKLVESTPAWIDAMPDAANVRPAGEAAPTSCPRCERVPLILLTLSAGIIEHARVGCLCRSVAL
jgi:hypothetical protein